MFARPGLPRFDYVRAASRGEAVHWLQSRSDGARLLMGGTDLFPSLRGGAPAPGVVIDVKAVPGLRDLSFDPQCGLVAGAAVTMNQLAEDPDVLKHYPLLAEAAGAVASYQVRNRATLGGNLCNASPCADTIPAVLVLEGELVVYGPAGERSVAVDRFVTGPGRTCLGPNEMLVAVRFPPAQVHSAGRYIKLGRFKTGDLALVGVAAYVVADRHMASGVRFRLGLGSVAAVPFRPAEAEAILAARHPGEETFALAARAAMEASSPITDVRATAGYQRAMVEVLTRRALRDVWAQMEEG